jgi:hypothetical protein
LAQGLAFIGVFLALDFTLLSSDGLRLFRLGLVVPFYFGFLSILEGGTSFCVAYAGRGAYDLHEKLGFLDMMRESATRHTVESEESKRIDRQKARRIYLEALAGAVLLTVVVFLA